MAKFEPKFIITNTITSHKERVNKGNTNFVIDMRVLYNCYCEISS